MFGFRGFSLGVFLRRKLSVGPCRVGRPPYLHIVVLLLARAMDAKATATRRPLLAWPSTTKDSAALLSIVTDGHRYASALRRLDVLSNHVAERNDKAENERLFKQVRAEPSGARNRTRRHAADTLTATAPSPSPNAQDCNAAEPGAPTRRC